MAYVSREKSIRTLIFCFFGMLILFGLGKGIKSAISLLFTAFMIINVFIPMIIQGENPISTTLWIASAIIIVSFVIIGGVTKKSLAATLGTIGGTVVAGLLAAYFSQITYISGVAEEHTQFLIRELGLKIDFKGLLFSGIIFGTIGAVMDVSMSVSAVIDEIKRQNVRANFQRLVISGISVGKDMMATMVNTLILAYAGVSLPMFVLLHYMHFSAVDIINAEIIAIEMIRALCGSMGLILTVPITAIIAGLMHKS